MSVWRLVEVGTRDSLRQPLAVVLSRLSRLALRSTGAEAAGFFTCGEGHGPRWVATVGAVAGTEDEPELTALCQQVVQSGDPGEFTDGLNRRLAVRALCHTEDGCLGAVFIRMDTSAVLSADQLESLADIAASASAELNSTLASSVLAALVDHMNAGMLLEGADRRGQLVNREFCSLFGVLPADVVGLLGGGLLASSRQLFESAGAFVSATNRVLRNGEPARGERFAARDGRWIERDYVPIDLPQGQVGHLWLFRDITRDLEAKAQLVERNTWLKLLHAVAEVASSTTQELTTLERAAALICEHTGWLDASVCTLQDSSDPLLQRAQASGEVCWRHVERRLTPGVRASTPRTQLACPIRLAGTVESALRFEIAGHVEPSATTREALAIAATTLGQSLARLRREHEIREQSLIDPLTTLYNRRGFMLLGQQQLNLAARQKGALVVFFMDLDGLKAVNDEYGHDIGDRAICETAGVLRASFRSTDIIARLAGDEFCVASVDLEAGDVRTVLDRLHSQLEALNQSEGRAYRLSLSVGHAAFDGRKPQSVNELLRRADQQMYANKQARKARIRTDSNNTLREDATDSVCEHSTGPFSRPIGRDFMA